MTIQKGTSLISKDTKKAQVLKCLIKDFKNFKTKYC